MPCVNSQISVKNPNLYSALPSSFGTGSTIAQVTIYFTRKVIKAGEKMPEGSAKTLRLSLGGIKIIRYAEG
jgi:hypothetical protein